MGLSNPNFSGKLLYIAQKPEKSHLQTLLAGIVFEHSSACEYSGAIDFGQLSGTFLGVDISSSEAMLPAACLIRGVSGGRRLVFKS